MLARQIVIGFLIATIFPLLVFCGVSTFDPESKRLDFVGGNVPPYTIASETPEERKMREDFQRTRQDAYNTAVKHFDRVLILVATPLGLAAILLGAFLGLRSIGTGLILGGILTVACGYFNYWEYLADPLRIISLLCGIVVLLFIGYWLLTQARVTQPSGR